MYVLYVYEYVNVNVSPCRPLSRNFATIRPWAGAFSVEESTSDANAEESLHVEEACLHWPNVVSKVMAHWAGQQTQLSGSPACRFSEGHKQANLGPPSNCFEAGVHNKRSMCAASSRACTIFSVSAVMVG